MRWSEGRYLFEINALGVGIFRPGAFFLAFDEKVDGLGGLLILRGRICGQFFTERAPADARESESKDEKDADNEGKEGVQCAHSLDG